MPQCIGVVKEQLENECRVALTPEGAAKFIKLKFDVLIEQGAGLLAGFSDEDYKQSGAKIVNTQELFSASNFILSINPLSSQLVNLLTANHTLIGNYSVTSNKELVKLIAGSGAKLMSLELMPRTSKAQVADILSSQNNLAGYYSILEATKYFPKLVPLMMTSAGMIAPAKVFVMGAGVAGLQAIATSKRLGAVVSGYDVRLATKEQVESLGAKFLLVDEEALKDSETAGGYAKEMSEEYKAKAKQVLYDHIINQDIIITTALIPGRKAPIMIETAMVDNMKPGSVIVDLAASGGGNCELTKPNEVVVHNGVTIVGNSNLACKVATTASTLYGNNILNLFKFFIKNDGEFSFDYEDDIIKNILATKDGSLLLQI